MPACSRGANTAFSAAAKNSYGACAAICTFITGRAEEILSFDLQRPIAERLGYAGRGGLSGVERFMKHYFLIAKEVGDLTAVLSAALEERHAKPAAVLDRFHIRVRRQDKLIKEFGFLIENGRLKAGRPDVLDHDPVNMIRMFWLADRYGVALHPDLMHLAISRLHLIDANLRDDPEANQLFLDVLSSRNSPEVVLRLMNEAGVLGRFIPPFGRIVAMMQFNMYHHYTVDEHLLRAVGYLADIDAQRHRDDLPLTNTIMASIEKRRALYVAVFLHDIAKGRTEDHSIAGAAVARHLCPRLGLTPAETETVAWLIENHLVMSDTAQRRDLADQRTIETFAARVQTIERLKMLFVLTVCDIQAVGPGVWNGWKGELLRTLFLETQIVLGGGHTKTERTERIQKAKAELRAQLPNWTDADFEAYAARHSQAYWLRVDLPRKIRHAQLLNQTEIDLPEPIIDIRTDAFRARDRNHADRARPSAPARDRRRRLRRDRRQYRRRADFHEQRRACRSIRSSSPAPSSATRTKSVAASGSHSPSSRPCAGKFVSPRSSPPSTRQRPKDTPFDVPAQVSIDNELSNRYTVIEVSGRDRPGLLYAITDILSQLNLNIASAHIVTFGEKAADVFYVTDLTGAKITTSGRRAAIRQKLLTAFPGQAAGKGRRGRQKPRCGLIFAAQTLISAVILHQRHMTSRGSTMPDETLPEIEFHGRAKARRPKTRRTRLPSCRPSSARMAS